eukprot:6191985-Pleurochrysis_carterae.AAC.1
MGRESRVGSAAAAVCPGRQLRDDARSACRALSARRAEPRGLRRPARALGARCAALCATCTSSRVRVHCARVQRARVDCVRAPVCEYNVLHCVRLPVYEYQVYEYPIRRAQTPC